MEPRLYLLTIAVFPVGMYRIVERMIMLVSHRCEASSAMLPKQSIMTCY